MAVLRSRYVQSLFVIDKILTQRVLQQMSQFGISVWNMRFLQQDGINNITECAEGFINETCFF